jgi:hypothetical protein
LRARFNGTLKHGLLNGDHDILLGMLTASFCHFVYTAEVTKPTTALFRGRELLCNLQQIAVNVVKRRSLEKEDKKGPRDKLPAAYAHASRFPVTFPGAPHATVRASSFD